VAIVNRPYADKRSVTKCYDSPIPEVHGVPGRPCAAGARNFHADLPESRARAFAPARRRARVTRERHNGARTSAEACHVGDGAGRASVDGTGAARRSTAGPSGDIAARRSIGTQANAAAGTRTEAGGTRTETGGAGTGRAVCIAVAAGGASGSASAPGGAVNAATITAATSTSFSSARATQAAVRLGKSPRRSARVGCCRNRPRRGRGPLSENLD